MRQILIVDDDGHLRDRLVRAFENRGYRACGAGSADEALAVLEGFTPQRAVVDLKMPGENGLELTRRLLARLPDLEVVILTGYGSIATAMEAVRLGAVSYLPKPADVDDILAAFEPQAAAAAKDEDIPTPSLARAEWEHINRVLADCGGNISAAARRLGVHRRTLQRKLSKYPPPQ